MIIVLLLLPFTIYAETAITKGEGVDETCVSGETCSLDESTYFIIGKVDFQVDGRTRDYTLYNALEITPGKIIIGKIDFYAYIADKRQLLINRRPLDESSSLDYKLLSIGDNRYEVRLQVYVKDSWNIIVLPYFKYDSNEGLLLSLRARDYNFLGTLETLAVNLNYRLEFEEEDIEASASALEIEIDYSLPFQAFSRDLVWGQKFNLAVAQDEPVYFRAGTDFSIWLPLTVLALENELRKWRLRFSNDYYLNREGHEDEDGWYFVSSLNLGTSFLTPITLGRLGQVSYGPSLFTESAYKPGSRISTDRRGVKSGFSHSLAAGRINWDGNFRNGMRISLSNTNTYNWTKGYWPITMSVEAQGHRSFGFAGLSSRLTGFKHFNTFRRKAGGPLRGILDRRVADAEAGVYLNVDFPIKMWVWFLEPWFEGHLSPFFDVGVVNPAASEDRSFDAAEDVWYSAGLEAFAFAKFSRAIYLRISVGVDFEAFLDDYKLTGPARDGHSRLGIFIGLGHHY